MGRSKGSTWHADNKIILALQFRPRRFNEFELALLEEFPFNLPEDARAKNPKGWELLERSHRRIWRIPRKTLARRLKALVAKGWITRKVLPEYGHHVEYRLNFLKGENMLKELPLPKLRTTRAEERLLRTLDAVGPLKEEVLGLENLSYDTVLEIFLRLSCGEVCPTCLENGSGEKAMHVTRAEDGRLYCRNCCEEVLLEECEGLLKKIMMTNFQRYSERFFKQIKKFFDAIDKQSEENK